MTTIAQLQAYAYDLKQLHHERDDMLDDMKRMYTLEWEEQKKLESQFSHMHVTLSPEPRNKLKTAVRLMTATQPSINVPRELQTRIGPEVCDALEGVAAIILRQSDRIRGNPLAYDACLSGLLYDEIHISVNDTSMLLDDSKGVGRAIKERYKRINRLTPYLLDVHDPHGCYSDFDAMGLTAWARSVDMTQSQILSRYGAAGEKALGDLPKKYATIKDQTVWSCWTLKEYACWIEGSPTPIHYEEEHNLPCIPVVVHTVEGSRAMFSDLEEQREPFLLTASRSGLWNRSNLFLSAMATNAASALWPQLAFVSQERDAPDIDLSVPWGVFHLYPNEQLTTWQKNLLEPSLVQLWQTTQALLTASTLYDQVAGAPLGPGSTYSETALLNQAGRLPLVGIQRKSAWAIGDALRIAFLLAKDGGSLGSISDVKPSEIPDDLELEVTMEVSLPQDRLQMANIVRQLQGIMPTEWLLENVFNVRQPGRMVDDAMAEQAAMAMWQAYVQKKVQEMMTPPQQMMPQGQPPAAPPAPPSPMMPPEGPVGNEILQGGLPAEMLAGGAQGPMAPNPTPEEGRTYGLEQV